MTSQVLAVFYLNDMDHFIKNELHIKGVIRYQDDFLLFHESKEYLKYCLEQLTIFLEKVREKALIISANNVYLFPSIIVDKENLKIINFHNALLPRHRGMNAPTWTIYEMDKKAGITWHLVNKNIDDGEIIIQKKINLNGTETAIYLIKQLMNLAFVAFEEIKYDLLDWNLKTYPMRNDIQYQIH